jgi:hypothetical protein
MANAPRGEWLNPLNRMIWQRAFKAKSPTMTLRNGQKFSISYDDHGRKGKVWVAIIPGHQKPDFDPFTPCGWFDYEEVVHPTWVSGGNKTGGEVGGKSEQD